jgi:hypothetical protein
MSNSFDEIVQRNELVNLTIPAMKGALNELHHQLRPLMEAQIVIDYADDPLRQQDWLDLLDDLGGDI